jgi:glycine oxidase
MNHTDGADVLDVAIAGGGLVGLGIAWRCAQRGMSVAVVDDAPGTGASYAAAGMLAPVAEVGYGEERLLELCGTSMARYPAFVAEMERASGMDVGLRAVGTSVVGFDADDMAALDVLHSFQRELGLSADRVTAREARRQEPALTPRLRGALHIAGDHSVNARALHAALCAAAQAVGVRTVASKAAALWVRNGRAAGLELAQGNKLASRAVVIALGARSTSLPGVPWLPVRPVKGQILRFCGAPGLLGGTVRALVRGRQVYLVPYGDDHLIIGATVEEKGSITRSPPAQYTTCYATRSRSCPGSPSWNSSRPWRAYDPAHLTTPRFSVRRRCLGCCSPAGTIETGFCSLR